MVGIVFKEVETKYELEQVFRLAYEVYVDELKRVNFNRLTEDERQKKQMSDEWDFRADTRHIIALKDAKAMVLPIVKTKKLPKIDISNQRNCQISRIWKRRHFAACNA